MDIIANSFSLSFYHKGGGAGERYRENINRRIGVAEAACPAIAMPVQEVAPRQPGQQCWALNRWGQCMAPTLHGFKQSEYLANIFLSKGMAAGFWSLFALFSLGSTSSTWAKKTNTAIASKQTNIHCNIHLYQLGSIYTYYVCHILHGVMRLTS